MNESLSLLLTKFKLQLETEAMPPELGGFYRCMDGKKQIVVNDSLPYDRKVEICFELIFKHCLDDRNLAFIPCYLLEEVSQQSKAANGN